MRASLPVTTRDALLSRSPCAWISAAPPAGTSRAASCAFCAGTSARPHARRPMTWDGDAPNWKPVLASTASMAPLLLGRATRGEEDNGQEFALCGCLQRGLTVSEVGDRQQVAQLPFAASPPEGGAAGAMESFATPYPVMFCDGDTVRSAPCSAHAPRAPAPKSGRPLVAPYDNRSLGRTRQRRCRYTWGTTLGLPRRFPAHLILGLIRRAGCEGPGGFVDMRITPNEEVHSLGAPCTPVSQRTTGFRPVTGDGEIPPVSLTRGWLFPAFNPPIGGWRSAAFVPRSRCCRFHIRRPRHEPRENSTLQRERSERLRPRPLAARVAPHIVVGAARRVLPRVGLRSCPAG